MTLSDDLRKSAASIAAHLSVVLRKMLVDCPHVTKLFMVSDSPSSQYRNRNMMYLVSVLCRDQGFTSMEWLFSEAGHGKGAPDGVGASVKRSADGHVARGGYARNAADLVALMPNTKISLVAQVS